MVYDNYIPRITSKASRRYPLVKLRFTMKGVIGIDISKEKFDVCFIMGAGSDSFKIIGSRSFENTDPGAIALMGWVAKKNKENVPVTYIMESTGVYYENLAYLLHESEQNVSVVLALKMKNYMKSLNVKTKTDKEDSKTIARYGMERAVELWRPMSSNYRVLRELSRELNSITKEGIRAKNQLHALKHSKLMTKFVKEMKQEQIEFYEEHKMRLKAEIKKQVRLDSELSAKIKLLESIPGVGFDTAVALVCETNGFQLVKNMRQLVSYAGLDVTHNESGKYKGKSKISKKGNKRIRQALYMPALAAIRSNEKIKEFSNRINERNPKLKRISIVACMRKLLILSFAIWQKEEEYNPGYIWKNTSGKEEIEPSFGQIKNGAMIAPH